MTETSLRKALAALKQHAPSLESAVAALTAVKEEVTTLESAVAATERRLPLAVYGDDEQQYAHHGSIVIMVLGCGAPRNDE